MSGGYGDTYHGTELVLGRSGVKTGPLSPNGCSQGRSDTGRDSPQDPRHVYLQRCGSFSLSEDDLERKLIDAAVKHLLPFTWVTITLPPAVLDGDVHTWFLTTSALIYVFVCFLRRAQTCRSTLHRTHYNI